MHRPLLLLTAIFASIASNLSGNPVAWDSAGAANPILPGYYADPSLVQHDGKTYLYATLDPWGDETLGCWESDDFKNWTYRVLNWPTKSACKSPTSGGASVWAPSVVRGPDGRFFMYISVRNEVWVGVAEHPLGPWKNALGDQPLINGKFRPGFHMIDAEAFIDDDGSAYLYWGSGYGWKNGRCWAAKLTHGMTALDGEVRDVTPQNYFEGPFMVKHGERYFLTYSQGVTIKDTYRVHYAVGPTPFGPFTEAENSPILATDHLNHIVSPGHHAIFPHEGRHYILYHRHSVPFDPKFIGRQTCVDPLIFTANGFIEKVTSTHSGPALIRGRAESVGIATGATVTASSQAGANHAPARVLDNNYATRWAAAPGDRQPWLQLDLGSVKTIKRQILRPEYAWKPCRLAVECSDDGQTWRRLADHTVEPATGSPIAIEAETLARYLRIIFTPSEKDPAPALFEWAVF
jgi:beta-xylosidase